MLLFIPRSLCALKRVTTLTEQGPCCPHNASGAPNVVAFHPDGKLLASAAAFENTVRLGELSDQ
jgi:hypothetical protein